MSIDVQIPYYIKNLHTTNEVIEDTLISDPFTPDIFVSGLYIT